MPYKDKEKKSAHQIAYMREYRKRNRDMVNAYARASYAANRQKKLDYMKLRAKKYSEYRRKNRELLSVKAKLAYYANREVILKKLKEKRKGKRDERNASQRVERREKKVLKFNTHMAALLNMTAQQTDNKEV